MTKENNTGPLEELLDKISNMELDSRRQEKYDRLVADARRTNSLRKRWLAGTVIVTAAACITVIIIINITLSGQDNSKVYDSFYSPHNFPVEYRGTDSLQTNFLESVRLYSEGEAEYAEKKLTPLLNEGTNNPDYLLLMSQILMEQGKFDASIIYLKKIIEFGGSYERTGLWYLALSYLATKKYDQCIEVLGLLSEPADSQFYKNATKLRNKVKRISNEQ